MHAVDPVLFFCGVLLDFKPFPLILLLLASLLFCLPPLALCIGSKQPLPMPPLEHSPEPEPPPPLVFKSIPTVVVKKVKRYIQDPRLWLHGCCCYNVAVLTCCIFSFYHFDRTKVTKPPKKGKAKAVKKPEKKKWDTVAAGQYIRGGKHVAVGWGKYGEAEHGEEVSVLFAIIETKGILALKGMFLFFLFQLLSGDEEDESSSDEEVDEEMETELAVSLAFDDVEETIEMPQAPGRFSPFICCLFVWMGGFNCCLFVFLNTCFRFLFYRGCASARNQTHRRH